MNLNDNIKNYIKNNINKYYNNNNINYPYQNIDNIYSNKYRIICIGDLHSDFESLYNCLLLSNVINNNGEWIGNNTYVRWWW